MQQIVSDRTQEEEQLKEVYQDLTRSLISNLLNVSVFRRKVAEDVKLLVIGIDNLANISSHCKECLIDQSFETGFNQISIEYDAIIFGPDFFLINQSQFCFNHLKYIESLLSENGVFLIGPPSDQNDFYQEFKSYFLKNGYGIKKIKEKDGHLEFSSSDGLGIFEDSRIEINESSTMQGCIMYRRNSLLGNFIQVLGIQSGFFNCGLFERSFLIEAEEKFQVDEHFSKVSLQKRPEVPSSELYQEKFSYFRTDLKALNSLCII